MQQRINLLYWSYFCLPLSGMACKLQVKFLLPFNKPPLPSREFTPCDIPRSFCYLLRVLEVKGRCSLLSRQSDWSTYRFCTIINSFFYMMLCFLNFNLRTLKYRQHLHCLFYMKIYLLLFFIWFIILYILQFYTKVFLACIIKQFY